jgi:hypothetical protein
MENSKLQELGSNRNVFIIFDNTDLKYDLFDKKIKNEKEGIFSPQPCKLFSKKCSRFEAFDNGQVSNFDLELLEMNNDNKNSLDKIKKDEEEEIIEKIINEHPVQNAKDFKFTNYWNNEETLNLIEENNKQKKDYLVSTKTTDEIDKRESFEKNSNSDFSVKKQNLKKKSRRLELNQKLKMKIKKLSDYWKGKNLLMPNVLKIKSSINGEAEILQQFLDFSAKRLLIRDEENNLKKVNMDCF